MLRNPPSNPKKGFTAVKLSKAPIPDPRSTLSDSDQPGPLLPTLDPADLAELVIAQMTPDARKKLTTLLITYNSSEVDQRGKVRDGQAGDISDGSVQGTAV